MHYKIVLCDDQEGILLLLQKYLTEIAQKESISMKIHSYQNPAVLVDEVMQNPYYYDLYFLDIDMPEMDGIELGQRIKSKNKDCMVIYITAHDRYAYKAYQLRAFHYVMKPIKKEKIKTCLMEAIYTIQKNTKLKSQGEIIILNKGQYARIPYHEIIYFEKNKNKVKLVSNKEQYEYYRTFKDLKKELQNNQFIQCHQGYLINKNKISGYEKNKVILEQTYEIPVSKKNVNAIKQIFCESLRR